MRFLMKARARVRELEEQFDADPAQGHRRKVAAQQRARREMEQRLQQALHKLRAATAECVNARARSRGLQRMPVRGLSKMRSVVLLFTQAHNLMCTPALAPQLLGLGPTPSAHAACTE